MPITRRLFLQTVGVASAQASGILPTATPVQDAAKPIAVIAIENAALLQPETPLLADGFVAYVRWINASYLGLQHINTVSAITERGNTEFSELLAPFMESVAELRSFGKNKLFTDKQPSQHAAIRDNLRNLLETEYDAYRDAAKELAEACMNSPAFKAAYSQQKIDAATSRYDLHAFVYALNTKQFIEQSITPFTDGSKRYRSNHTMKDAVTGMATRFAPQWISEETIEAINSKAKQKIDACIAQTSNKYGVGKMALQKLLSLSDFSSTQAFILDAAPQQKAATSYAETLANLFDDKTLFAELANVVSDTVNSDLQRNSWYWLSDHVPDSAKDNVVPIFKGILDGRFEKAIRQQYKAAFSQAFPDVPIDSVPLPVITDETKDKVRRQLQKVGIEYAEPVQVTKPHEVEPTEESKIPAGMKDPVPGVATLAARAIKGLQNWVSTVKPSTIHSQATESDATDENPPLALPEPGQPIMGTFTAVRAAEKATAQENRKG